jgi:hypothetical protein
MRKILLTYFTDKDTGLQKLGKVSSETQLVSAKTGIRIGCPSGSRASVINGRETSGMQSSSFCTIYFSVSFSFFYSFIHICIYCLGHFSPLPSASSPHHLPLYCFLLVPTAPDPSLSYSVPEGLTLGDYIY